MTLVSDAHTELGATFRDRGGREVVDQYGRPASAGRAVRNGVGTIEMGYGILAVTGEDRVEFVDNAVSNTVPTADGEGVYALLCDPQGRITADMYVYNAGERLLVFLPPERAEPVCDDWSSKVFIQDVEIRDASAEFGVFGVHGPTATEKVASVLNGAGAPEPALTFVRGSMNDAGVTVIATDNPLGEDGYEIVCATADAPDVFDTLLTRGLNSAPFGYRTWDALSAEAGTPLFEHEMAGVIPNVLGVHNAIDFEKGCYVGQEVVSRVENQGRPSRRLVGLDFGDALGEKGESGDALGDNDESGDTLGDGDESDDAADGPVQGAAVFDGDAAAGELTRVVDGPAVGTPIALALVEFDNDADAYGVRVDDTEVPAERVDLPFLEGSVQSARLPDYTA